METPAFSYWEGVETVFLNRVKEITNVHKRGQKPYCLFEAHHVKYCWLARLYAKQKSLKM